MLRTPIRRSALALLLVACALTAQAPRGRALAIEDYYKVKTVGTVELSPDARWVALMVTTRVEETNGATSEVWLVPADGSAAARRVSADGANASGLAWMNDGRLHHSVDGRAIVFDPAAPERTDTTSTYVEVTVLGGRGGRGGGRGGRGGGGGPLPSPDGKWIATVRDVPPPRIEKVYASSFEKRHEERFKGVEFDWMEFHRDAAPLPLPNAKDPAGPRQAFLRPV